MSTALAPTAPTSRGMAPAAEELVHVTQDQPGVRALDDVDLAVRPGSFVAVIGHSGSGKSTLLQCAAGLETPTAGQVLLDGRPTSGRNETQRTLLRRDRVGVVFQSDNLLPGLTVADDVMPPLRLAGQAPDLARVTEPAKVYWDTRRQHRRWCRPTDHPLPELTCTTGIASRTIAAWPS